MRAAKMDARQFIGGRMSQRGIEAIISKRNITNRMNYLQYLKGQKEIKRTKAEEREVDAREEVRVIDKMINRENAKGVEE